MEENNHHRVGHEETDVNPWVVGKFAIGLTVVCVLSLGLLYGVFRFMLSQEGGKAPEIVKSPPNPRLEVVPPVELRAFRTAEDQELSTYGWVDQQKGVVRIPIDRAIDLLAKKGLPARTEQPAASNVTVPMESGLGPKMLPSGGPLAGDMK